MTDDDDPDPEIDYLKAQALHERRYHQLRRAHPDPRDPDYPGDWDE